MVEQLAINLFVDDGVGAIGLFGGLYVASSLEVVVICCIFHQQLYTEFNLLFRNRPRFTKAQYIGCLG